MSVNGYVCVCVLCYNARVAGRRQLLGAGSFLPPCEFQG